MKKGTKTGTYTIILKFREKQGAISDTPYYNCYNFKNFPIPHTIFLKIF